VKTDTAVELFYDDTWNDETDHVFTRADINIERGRANESGNVQATSLDLTLDNRGGRFSPRNPASPLYGKIGRNTPIRVLIGSDVRATCEVAKWPQAWDPKGVNVYTPIQAAGIMRRLGQGATPLQSAPRRHIPTTGPVAYWPLDDGKEARTAAPAVGPSLMQPNFTSVVEFARSTDIGWLEALPTFDGTLRGQVSMPDAATEWGIAAVVLPADGSAGPEIHAQYDEPAAGDDYMIMGVFQLSAGVETLRSYWTFFPDSGSSTGADFDWSAPGLLDGEPHYIELRVSQNGANIEHEAYMDGAALSLSAGTGVITSRTLRAVDGAYVGGLGDTVAGHFAVWDDLTAMDEVHQAGLGYRGETAGNRIDRLCTEEGVAFTSTGDLDDTAAMGPQPIDTFLELARQCAEADLGILYEPRDSIGLSYRTRADLYNQAPVLELDYDAGVFGSLPEPVDDDQATRNDVTAKRLDGQQARAQLATGALSVQAPPDGVGRYDTSVEINVVGDGFLPDQASWRLALGTVNEARYPSLHLNLGAPTFTADALLTADAAAVDIGDRLTVANPPAWLPPELISVLAQGFTETIGNNTWDITINTSPELPWQVAEYEASEGGDYRYDTAGASLAAEFDAGTDTSMSVDVDIGPLWTVDDDEFPFDIEAGGVRLTVTDISGASSPQTFTITQAPVNGVEKTIPAGTAVSLWTKARYALGG
jgi:hypothetical protein